MTTHCTLPDSIEEIEFGVKRQTELFPLPALDYSKAGRLARLLALPGMRVASDLIPPPAPAALTAWPRPEPWEIDGQKATSPATRPAELMESKQ